MARPKPLLLIILDGFGISPDKEGNPVAQAKKPTLDEIEKNFPLTALQASGTAVGLPWGEAGNSEVGHLTLGSGRVIYHSLPRIIYAIYDGSFFKNPAFLKVMEHVKKNNSRLHLAGLVSSGSVHSYIDHLYGLLELAKRENVEKVYLHVFTDGKDAPPEEGAKFLAMLEERMRHEWPNARFASVCGRFYAMDRDEKWDRTKAAYDLMTEGKGEKIFSLPKYLENSYKNGITDEFIKPAQILLDKISDGKPVSVMSNNQLPAAVKAGDGLIFFNFREDSMREITSAFAEGGFDKFARQKIPDLALATMTEYQKGSGVEAAFPPLEIKWPLARALSEKGMSQLHIAETEKYAHVTYFFNGGREKPFPGEDCIMIPSPETAHFDEVPQMRASEITAKILENFEKYDAIIANFANADMVGHSGNFKAAVAAVEALDSSLAELMNAVLKKNAAMIVTGDHGNIELKRDPISGEKLTEHSANPVPLYLIGPAFRLKKPRSGKEITEAESEIGGILTDVAPTFLEILEIKKPEEMSGKSLYSDLLKQK